MKAVGKNDVLMWHVFYRLIFYVPCVFHPDKNWRKLKNFEWEGSRNAEPFFFPISIVTLNPSYTLIFSHIKTKN